MAIGLGLAALAGLGYALVASVPRPDPEHAVSLQIGTEHLTVPSAYLRPGARGGEAGGSVELAAFYPGFRPAGGVDDISARTDISERFQRIVFLTLRPADVALDPAERTARLYERFLVETSWSHPGGLTARAFESGSPFEGDELYYVQPEGREFAARCQRPDPARKTPNTCISVLRVAGLDVEIRFVSGLLADWQKVTQGARRLVEAARR